MTFNDSQNSSSSYSWHQSHDQATVLFHVPFGTTEADIHVEIEPTGNYIVAGVRGQPPTIKGRFYARVDSTGSMWQLEPLRLRSRLSARERTNSTTSTASTHSSYAFISDPEISSSFAASLESGPASDSEDVTGYSSPVSPRSHPVSRSVSPGRLFPNPTSSLSSLESLHVHRPGRLLTLHLEKKQSIIWPSLIVGPCADTLSPPVANSVVFKASEQLEHQYNMDPTSLILTALELFDIRQDREASFEYFLRAWHQAHLPASTMRLVSHYLPLHKTADLVESKTARPGTVSYYAQCIGGEDGLAQLYLEAGMLHLEGAASALLVSSAASLSSLRVSQYPLHSGDGATEAWRNDRDAASRYFERARSLQPGLDIPVLPPLGPSLSRNPSEQLEMPSIDLSGFSPPEVARRRRKLKDEGSTTIFDDRGHRLPDLDNTWYLYVPGLVGTGTALLLVGVIGALSFSSWSRRNQGS